MWSFKYKQFFIPRTKIDRVVPPFDICLEMRSFTGSSYILCGRYEIPENIKSVNNEWLAKSALATANDKTLIPIMHELFAKEGVFFPLKQSLGGDHVLLSFENLEVMKGYLCNGAS